MTSSTHLSPIVKYTEEGSVTVEARAFDEPHGLRDPDGIAVEIIVADTGCGISSAKLESIFREFEQVESMDQTIDNSSNNEGVGKC
jgi:signal transduction histidine kinase